MPNQSKKLDKPSKNLNKVSKQSKSRRFAPQLQAQRPGTTEFAKLQADWHAKLASDGFKDLERFNPQTGEALDMLNTMSLKGLAKSYNPATETYFRRITNFATHNPNWGRDYIKNQIMKMHADSVPYRTMVRRLQESGHKLSIFKVFYVVKQLAKAAKTWNKTHPEGLDFEADIEPSTTSLLK